MPEVFSTVAFPWTDGDSVFGSTSFPWTDGDSVFGPGGAYVRHDPPVGSTVLTPGAPAPGSRITAAAFYKAVHTVDVIDERDETSIPVEALSISTDVDSLMWALSASVQHEADAVRAKLIGGAQPVILRVELDGDVWRFVVDSVSRSRDFAGGSSVAITARSPTVAAGAPFQGEQNWTIDEPTTAAQLCGIANLYTGLSVSFELDDWIVPARVFNFNGTPLAVVKAVADAVGAVVMSDRRELAVRVVPRYRLMPNEWAVSAPDVEVPIGCSEADGFERDDKPAYNAVPLSGQQSGVSGIVRLDGTNGGFAAPLVTDLLLTEEPALRQRGLAVLGAGGEQAKVNLRLPVLYGEGLPGVLSLGQLLRVIDTDGTWHGVVRAVRVDVDMPAVYQAVVLERHTKLIPGTELAPSVLNPLVWGGPWALPPLVIGSAASFSVAGYWSGGSEPYAWSMRDGALPAGLTLNGSTGVVSGTPSATGAYSFRLRAVDDVDNMSDSAAATGTVLAAVAFAGTIAGQTATVGVPYSFSIASYWSGGATPYAYTMHAGALPAGLTLTTGLISGTPTTAGTSSGLVVKVTDATGGSANSNSFGFTVAPPALVFSGTIAAQNPIVAVPFSLNIASYWSGGVPPYAFTVQTGTLPAGLSLNSSTGAITGTPTTAGSGSVTFRATDAAAQTQDSNSVAFTTASGVGDPLWSKAWLRLLLDSTIADASPNTLPVARTAIGSGHNASADLQTGAAKYGAKGWQCFRNDGANTASAIVANISALSSGIRTWGTKNFWAGGWVRVGDNAGPTGTRQRRFSLGYQTTNGLWFSTLAGVVNVQLRATGFTTPFSAATIGTVAGGTGSTLSTAAGAISDNGFHHIACGRNGSTFRIWVDGVVMAECTVAITMPAIDEVSVGGVPSLGILTTCSGDPTATADYLDDWVVYLDDPGVATQFFSPPAEAMPTGTGVMRVVFTGATLGATSPIRTTTGNPKTARDAWAAACSNVGVMDFESNCSFGDPLPTGLSFAGSSPARTGTIAGGVSDQMCDNFGLGFLGSFNTTGAHPAELDGIFVYFEPPATLTVTFSAAVAAFGCYITDLGDSAEKVTARLTKSGGGTLDYIVPTSKSTANAQCLWWGFVDPTGTTYTQVEFIVAASGGSIGFDDFSVGVPA